MKGEETELNDELEKLHFEIDKLREMKSDEQHNLLFLTNHINDVKSSTDNSNGSTNNEIGINDDELQAAEKRKKLLEAENTKLEIQLGELGGKIGSLDEQQADLQALIDEKKLELKNLDDSVSESKRQELIKLDEKISNLKENETKTVNEFEKRLGELSLKEKSLRDSINLKNKELEEIENNMQKNRAREDINK